MTHFALMRPWRREIRPGHAVTWRGEDSVWRTGEVIDSEDGVIECRQRIPRGVLNISLVQSHEAYSVVVVEDPL